METYRLPDESGVFEIYMGSLSCMRHRGQEFYELQQQGRLAFLIMDEVDFVTGAYIDTIKKASREIFLKRNPRALRISADARVHCCQPITICWPMSLLRSLVSRSWWTRTAI